MLFVIFLLHTEFLTPAYSKLAVGGAILRFLPHVNSGFSSNPRINLSPFTKDFRGEEHYNESIDLFLTPSLLRVIN